jgi:hypothetical protein
MALLPRTHELTPSEFVEHHLIPRAPVIVAGEVPQWPAYTAWTWDYLVDCLGGYDVDIHDDWFQPSATATFGAFVTANIGVGSGWKQRYVRWFSRNSDSDGHWADDAFAILRPDWRPPSFLPSTGYIVPPVAPPESTDPTVDAFPYRALFVSGSGARTRLHIDPWGSSAVLCQVVGDKHVTMWPPAQHETMLRLSEQSTSGEASGVVPAFDDVLSAGEVLFIPTGWWHEVDTVTDSVSVTWNFLYKAAADALRTHITRFPDDPELEVVTYFLRGRLPGVSADADAASLVTASIHAQAPTAAP